MEKDMKTFLIEVVDVSVLDESDNLIDKQQYPVFEDELGKYIEIYFYGSGKRKHYLKDNTAEIGGLTNTKKRV
jgi:hypothetical protein